jgi:hypothetical protein
MVIEPTIGRVVWYWPPKVKPSQPMAAIITYVHDTHQVNLVTFRRTGESDARQNVYLLQEGSPTPRDGDYAQWMPYQVGQAKKHEGK